MWKKTSYSNSREIDPYVQQVEIGIDIDRQGNGLRTINDTGWFFYWSALKKTKYQTLRKFLHLELFWRDLHVICWHTSHCLGRTSQKNHPVQYMFLLMASPRSATICLALRLVPEYPYQYLFKALQDYMNERKYRSACWPQRNSRIGKSKRKQTRKLVNTCCSEDISRGLQ